MSEVVCEIVSPPGIGEKRRAEMFALMQALYEAVDREAFGHDLDAKDFVILVQNEGAVVGFTTGAVRQTEIDGRTIRYMYSGDTLVHPEFWGSGHFLPVWSQLMGNIKAAVPSLPLYWFLITKGHRTYRLLTNFFRSYVPRASGDNDPALMRVRDAVAGEMFSSFYDPATGLIDFGTSRGHLAPALLDASELATNNRAVRDFLTLNPEHGRGVELACIAELAEANMRHFAATRFGEGLREGLAVTQADSGSPFWEPYPGLYEAARRDVA